MTDRRHQTTCERCGETVAHAYGVPQTYCDDCARTLAGP